MQIPRALEMLDQQLFKSYEMKVLRLSSSVKPLSLLGPSVAGGNGPGLFQKHSFWGRGDSLCFQGSSQHPHQQRGRQGVQEYSLTKDAVEAQLSANFLGFFSLF